MSRDCELLCTACGSVHRLGNDYRFTDEPRTIGSWYDTIREAERPLLDSATLEQLLQSRMQDYCETAVRMIDTDGLSPQRIALKLSKFL